MEIKNVYKVLVELEKINNRKAKKLAKLIDEYSAAPTQEGKLEVSRRINNFLYNLFMSCLTRRFGHTLYNLSVTINEDCYTVEQLESDGWFIFNDGAKRADVKDDKIVFTSIVPREYKKGFYLREQTTQTEEERQKEISFLRKYKNKLANISDLMDRKQEMITYEYEDEIRDPRIPQEFVELLITTLGFQRIPQEEKDNISTK